METGTPVALVLHEAQAYERLRAGGKNARLRKIVTIVQRNLPKRHWAVITHLISPCPLGNPGIGKTSDNYEVGLSDSICKSEEGDNRNGNKQNYACRLLINDAY